jgi:hypothetical protein
LLARQRIATQGEQHQSEQHAVSNAVTVHGTRRRRRVRIWIGLRHG